MPESLTSITDAIRPKCTVFAKTRFAARDPTRRLGGALAAQRAVSGRSWMGLAPCKKRRMLEVTLGQQEPLGHNAFASANKASTYRDQGVVP